MLRGQALIDRLLVASAALTFGPVVYELLLGQIVITQALQLGYDRIDRTHRLLRIHPEINPQ